MERNKLICNKNIINGILILSSVLLGLMFIYINLVTYKYGLNADIASEGVLAKVIWESGEWIPKEWYFSTESRVVSVANLASLFYGMTGNICLSMGLGCVAGMLFVLYGAYGLCREMEFDFSQICVFLLLLMLLPNHKDQIELMYVYGGHYVFHIGIYFITLSIYLKMLKRKTVTWYVALALYLAHFILGVQGVRGILMITGPLLAVEIVRRIYIFYGNKDIRKADHIMTAFVAGLNVAAFLGGKLPISIGHPFSRNIRNAPEKLFEIVLRDFGDCISWRVLSLPEKMVFAGCLGLVIGMTFFILWKGIKKRDIAKKEWIFLNFVVSVFLTIAALTFTTVESSSRYFVVIYFAIAMGIAVLWNFKKESLRYVFLFLMMIVFIGNAKRLYYPMLTEQSYQDDAYVKIGEYLEQEGYEYAYTGFEHANMITIMSNGKVQAASVASFSDMSVNKWLSSKKWYVPNVPKESRTAYVVTEERMEEFLPFLEKYQEELEYKTQIGGFYIYGSEYNYSKLAK